MVGFFQYPAAQASIRAGMSQLLPARTWPLLLNALSLEAIVEILNDTSYRDVLSGLPLSIEDIERNLQGRAARLFHMPIKFLSGGVQDLVDWLWRHYEVDNLITLVRAIHHGETAARIRSSLVPLETGTDLNWHAMSLADSLETLLDWLNGSHNGQFYAAALNQAFGEYQRQNNVFILEIALYLAYYNRLVRLMENLGGDDGRDARTFIGTILDGRNLLWAYRYHAFFGLSAEEILGYTLHRATRVNAGVVRRIAMGAPLVETVEQIWDGRLLGTDRLAKLPLIEALVELEIGLQRYLHHLARQTLQKFSFRLEGILGYIIIVETEIDDIVTMIEGAFYGWSGERIRPFLIGLRSQH